MTTVLSETNAGIAVLTLNWAERRNALTPEMFSVLRQAISRAECDKNVRCLVLRGAGDHFTVGADLGFFEQRMAELGEGESVLSPEDLSAAHDVIKAIQQLPKPVLASVRGSVAGIGVGLMQACDLIITATDVVCSLAYCHIGLSPDGGASYFLPRAVGLKRSMEMALLGNRYTAEQLLSMGLVNRVVEVADLETETMKLASRLAAGSARSHAHTKSLINNSLLATLDEQLIAEERHVVDCLSSADFTEGVKTFCAGRRPRFTGPDCQEG